MTSPLRIGYWLSSEEHGPARLVDLAVTAEEVGFPTAMISDHFHPWTSRQGQAPFVWSVLGAIGRATSALEVGTGVTAPIRRMHPVVVAHAAATVAAMMPGRFFLGLGTGERLNEHITGEHWPRPGTRRRMLEEAVGVIRDLWSGDEVNHHGRFFTVEHARLFTRPEVPPPLLLAVGGRRSAELAGRVADGMIGVTPSEHHITAFEASGGAGKPRRGQVHVCWAPTEEEARRTARQWWPQQALPSSLLTELARPAQFEDAASLVSEGDVAKTVVCGPDPERHLAAIGRFAAAGFDDVYVHQVGPDQEGFFRFYADAVLPLLPS